MIENALELYGQKEVTGSGSNPVILEMIQYLFPKWKDDSTIAWCSVFVNYIAMISGYEYTWKGTARSWLKIGKKVAKPTVGDIVVLWRSSPKSWKGHVGFYIRSDEDYVWILGGNQGDAVNIRKYNISRVLGYRGLGKAI